MKQTIREAGYDPEQAVPLTRSEKLGLMMFVLLIVLLCAAAFLSEQSS